MPTTAAEKSIQVVAGIIWNSTRDALLIACRPEHLHKGGYWEFPGGKIEQNETAEQALARELQEELNIRFSDYRFFRAVDFAYPEKQVSLRFFEVFDVNGEIRANEGQQWRWINLPDLRHYRFPEANRAIVEALLQA